MGAMMALGINAQESQLGRVEFPTSGSKEAPVVLLFTFTTPTEFEDEFLAGWIRASSDCRVTDARYTDAGDTVVARFVAKGTNDGPLGSFPATGKTWALPVCEMWHFDAAGRVVGGEIYYDQVSLLAQLELLPEPTLA